MPTLANNLDHVEEGDNDDSLVYRAVIVPPKDNRFSMQQILSSQRAATADAHLQRLIRMGCGWGEESWTNLAARGKFAYPGISGQGGVAQVMVYKYRKVV